MSNEPTKDFFSLKTPEGITMEIEPDKVEEFVIGVLGKKYRILITEVIEE